MTTGERIRYYRKLNDMSMVELAHRIGVQHSAIAFLSINSSFWANKTYYELNLNFFPTFPLLVQVQ